MPKINRGSVIFQRMGGSLGKGSASNGWWRDPKSGGDQLPKSGVKLSNLKFKLGLFKFQIWGGGFHFQRGLLKGGGGRATDKRGGGKSTFKVSGCHVPKSGVHQRVRG